MRLLRFGFVGLAGLLAACAHNAQQSPTQRQIAAEQGQSSKALQRASDAQARADRAAADADAAEARVLADQQKLAEDQSIAQARARNASDKRAYVAQLSGQSGSPGQGYSGATGMASPFDQQRLDKARTDATDAQVAAEDARAKAVDDERQLEDDRLSAKQLRETAITAQREAADVSSEAADQARRHQEEALRAQRAQAAEAQSTLPSVSGRLSSATEDRVIILPSGQSNPLQLEVSSGTEVYLNGRRIGVRSLPAGSQIRAAYEPGAQGLPLAKRIDATSNVPPSSTP